MNRQPGVPAWLHRFSLRQWLAIGFNSVIAVALVAAAASVLMQERFVGAVRL